MIYKVAKNMILYDEIDRLLQKLGSQSTYNGAMFFKTEPGSYGAHDQFLGIKSPVLRQIAKQYKDLSFDELDLLMKSPCNEYRLLGLFMLVHRYQKAGPVGRDEVYQFYMDHVAYINNWNLVDASAHYIVGAHHFDGRIDRSVLDELINSSVLWHRRIAIVATWYHIRKNHGDLTLSMVERVLGDKHDLIHKAAGWMLRELGKKNERQLRDFLDINRHKMPRTMLRYAVERLPDKATML